MSGRLADINSAVNVTLPVPDGACFVWVTNTGGAPISVGPGAGAALMGGAASYSLPVGKQFCCTYYCGGAFWQLRQAG